MKVLLIGIQLQTSCCTWITHRAADPILRLPTEIADDTPLDNEVSPMLIVHDIELDTAYAPPCFTYEEH